MNKDRQIEEMAKDFCAVGIPCEECHLYKNRCHAKKYATRAYNNGYRKASEVVEEFAYSLKDFLHDAPVVYQAWFGAKIDRYVEIFKKKYTEEGK